MSTAMRGINSLCYDMHQDSWQVQGGCVQESTQWEGIRQDGLQEWHTQAAIQMHPVHGWLWHNGTCCPGGNAVRH